MKANVLWSELLPVAALFRECTPRILVYTDSLNFQANHDFGLTVFVETLRASTIHGMTPIVVTASRNTGTLADKEGFSLDDPTSGVLISRYDVVFLFGRDTELAPITDDERNALATFMEAGGGVFATGDHETLGAGVSGKLLRIRAMRRWNPADAPPGRADQTRHSTNRSGSNESEDFEDQEDTTPQVLYPNFRTEAGGLGSPHPLLQLARPRRVLEVFPDHPHEGECVVPDAAALSRRVPIGHTVVTEWPNDALGTQVLPDKVAFTVSYGDGFAEVGGSKQPLEPKLYIAIVAYDGHRAKVGRAVTDATWHHFVNVNLDGASGNGALRPGGVDSEALVRIRQYYTNLATWLMPARTRRCLRWPLLVDRLYRYPLFEELPFERLVTGEGLAPVEIGSLLVSALARDTPPYVIEELIADAIHDAMGPKKLAALRARRRRGRGLRTEPLALAALGGLFLGGVTAMANSEGGKQHDAIDALATKAAQAATRHALDQLVAEQLGESARLKALLQE